MGPVAFTASLKYYIGQSMQKGEYFVIWLLVWPTNLFKKKKPDFFQTTFIWVGSGLRLGLGLGLVLGLELVSKVVFRAFFEISFTITKPDPHVSHANFPDFCTLC